MVCAKNREKSPLILLKGLGALEWRSVGLVRDYQDNPETNFGRAGRGSTVITES